MSQKQPYVHHLSSLLGTVAGWNSPENGSGLKGAGTGGGEERTDGKTRGGGRKSQRAGPTDPNSQPAGKSEDFSSLTAA